MICFILELAPKSERPEFHIELLVERLKEHG